jgi:hypothetical protein
LWKSYLASAFSVGLGGSLVHCARPIKRGTDIVPVGRLGVAWVGRKRRQGYHVLPPATPPSAPASNINSASRPNRLHPRSEMELKRLYPVQFSPEITPLLRKL